MDLYTLKADRNLEELTPPWLHFRILTPRVEMRARMDPDKLKLLNQL